MPSDRSTLQRGAPGGDHSAWQEPTAPGGRRLPSAPRERKPALAALAVLLILGCALGTGFLVIQSGKRVAAIEISQEVGAGQRIPATAMQEVQIASNSGLSYVPWNQAAQVARFYAASPIPAGTLLTNAMVASSTTSTAGRALEGLALKDGQLPRGLQVGQHIDIYEVSDSTQQCPGHPGSTLAPNAIVIAIDTPEINSGTSAMEDVEVALAPGGRRARWRATPPTASWASPCCPTAGVVPGRPTPAGTAVRAAPSPVRAPAAARPPAARPRTRPPADSPGRRRPAMGPTDPWR